MNPSKPLSSEEIEDRRVRREHMLVVVSFCVISGERRGLKRASNILDKSYDYCKELFDSFNNSNNVYFKRRGYSLEAMERIKERKKTYEPSEPRAETQAPYTT